MLLFIILVILTKSLISLLATQVGFSFDAAVATAGLVSYIGLFSYIFWPREKPPEVSMVLGEVFSSLKGISKLPIICSKASLHAPQRVQSQDRPWCGGSFWRKTTRRNNASERSSVLSMMSGSFALVSLPKILSRCVAHQGRRPRRPSTYKSRHPLQALWKQRMRRQRAIRRGVSACPTCSAVNGSCNPNSGFNERSRQCSTPEVSKQ